MGEQTFTKLTYAANIQITAGGAGLVGVHTFRGNDITDPDFSGGGHQAFMNDLFGGLYGRYVVYGCKIVVTSATANTGLPAQKIYLRARKSVILPTVSELEEERKWSKTVMLGPGVSTGTKTVSMYMPTHVLFGTTKTAVLTDDLFGAVTSTTATSSPTNAWYWTISDHCLDATQVASIHCNVRLIYYCKFSLRIPQGQS